MTAKQEASACLPSLLFTALCSNPFSLLLCITDELKPVCFPETALLGKVNIISQDPELCPFDHTLPEGRIFGRQCYEPLLQKVFDAFINKKQVKLTGTPGVGKSLFGLLLLRTLIQRLKTKREDDPAWLKMLGGRIIYEQKTGSDHHSFYEIDTVNETIFKINGWPFGMCEFDVFLFRDGPCGYRPFGGYIFWASSPRPDDFQKYTVGLKTELFYMPAWTEQELIDCWRSGCAPANLFSHLQEKASQDMPHRDVIAALEVLIDFCELELPLHRGLREDKMSGEILACLAKVLQQSDYQEAVLRRWIADLGPVARRVFDPYDSGYKRLFGALGLDKEELIEFLQDDKHRNDTVKFNHAHALLIMHATPDFTNFSFTPSSPSVGRVILSTLLRNQLSEAQKLMGRIRGTNKGLVFEPLAHHLLRTSKTAFQAHSLTNPSEKISVELHSPNECNVTDEQLCQSNNFKIEDKKYYLPTNSSFSVVDAWTSHYMFQMTVSSLTNEYGHPIKSASKLFLQLRDRYNGVNPKLIFVVPKSEEEHVRHMKPQAFVCMNGKKPASSDGPQGGWNKLEQFVLFL